MKLTGSYQINLEKQKVWEALNDPEILKQAIPGCKEFKKNFIFDIFPSTRSRAFHKHVVLHQSLKFQFLFLMLLLYTI